jgi:hypothetical protein
MSKKIAKALIGGNWKCNGTVGSIKAMSEVLNKAGSFSPNSQVVIAAPTLHLQQLKSILRPDINIAAEVSCYQSWFLINMCNKSLSSFSRHERMSDLRKVSEHSPESTVQKCYLMLELNGH